MRTLHILKPPGAFWITVQHQTYLFQINYLFSTINYLFRNILLSLGFSWFWTFLNWALQNKNRNVPSLRYPNSDTTIGFSDIDLPGNDIWFVKIYWFLSIFLISFEVFSEVGEALECRSCWLCVKWRILS